MVRIIAAIKGRCAGGGERRGMKHSAAMFLAELGVLGQQPKSNEQVGLATPHRLFQVENRLSGDPCEARDALADEILHALGNVRLFEELGAVTLSVDQLIELFDLVAELDGKRVGLEDAGVADCFHYS